MANIKIEMIKKGAGIESWEKDIKIQFLTVEDGIRLIGGQLAEHMKNTIKDNKKRRGSKNELEDAIQVHGIPKGVGVGKISLLPPYWYVLNYGTTKEGTKFIPPANFGSFEGNPPSAGIQNEQWIHTGRTQGAFFMRPKTFTPIDYIDKAKSWLNSNFRAHFSGYIKKSRLHIT